MQGRIWVDQMMDAQDAKGTVIGDTLGTRKQDNVALPERLWLLAHRRSLRASAELAIAGGVK
jgi:hypothetical protein